MREVKIISYCTAAVWCCVSFGAGYDGAVRRDERAAGLGGRVFGVVRVLFPLVFVSAVTRARARVVLHTSKYIVSILFMGRLHTMCVCACVTFWVRAQARAVYLKRRERFSTPLA